MALVERHVDEIPRVDLLVVVNRRLVLIVEVRRGVRQRGVQPAELKFEFLVLVRVDNVQAKVSDDDLKILTVQRVNVFDVEEIDVRQTGAIAEADACRGDLAGEEKQKSERD